MGNFSVIDYIIFSIVLMISLFIGLHQVFKKYYSKIFKACYKKTNTISEDRNKSEIKEYLIANGTMGTIPIALSLLASFFSATALLGNPAEVYQYGIQFYISTFGLMVTPIIGAFLTGPMIARLNVSSVFEYFKLRYNSDVVRFLAIICYLTRNLISTAIYIYGPATALYLLINMSSTTAIIIITTLGTIYTAIGGIRAVIWTDVFQICIMFAGFILICVKGLYDVGGLSRLFQINSEGGRLNAFNFDPNPFLRQTFWSVFFGMIANFAPYYCIDQQMIQRFSATRNIRSAQIALLLNVPGIFFLLTLTFLPGLIIYATYAKCDPLSLPNRTITSTNQLLPYYVLDKLNSIKGSIGIVLAALFAGSLSSVSSALNSTAAILWVDIFQHFSYFKTFSDKKSTLTTKFLVLIFGALSGILAFIISTLGTSLIQVYFTLNGSFNAPTLGAFILASVFPFTNSYGASCGLLAGFGVGLWLSFGSYTYKPVYPKLKFGTECLNNTSNHTLKNNIFLNVSDSYVYGEAINLSGFNKIYSISYMWFSAIGIIATVSVGLIVSVLTRCDWKPKKTSKNRHTVRI